MQFKVSKKIKKANLIDEPLKLLKGFEHFKNGELNVKFESKRSAALDEATKKWCFDLLQTNMKAIYEKSKSGWHENEKRTEMFDRAAYYLIGTNTATNKPVAYCHFRFDMDFDNEIVYCYELQIENDMRRHGLGAFMMEILEQFAEELELEKVMLTVSKYNQSGQKFFKQKMNYERDETDTNDEDPDVDYEILSKTIWEDADDEDEENAPPQ